MTRVVSRARTALAVVLSTQGLLLTACGSGTPELTPGDVAEDTGSVGLSLDVSKDVHLATVSYDIVGNGVHKTGSFDVSHSKTIAAVIGGIPAGSGYALTLLAADTKDSSILCVGSAVFNVVARQTSTAKVRLDCPLPNGNGSVSVTGTTNVCPRIDSLSVSPDEVIVGSSVALSAAFTDSDQSPAAATLAWQTTGGTLTNPTSANASLKCTAPGTFTVTLNVTDSACTDTASATVVCSPGNPPPTITFNEVESSGGTPGDWAELENFGSAPVDLSGFVYKDNDDTHNYVLPSGSVVAPGAYFLIEEAQVNFGLGAADSVRLFDLDGNLVDSYSWTAHAATTYGRCPNATGAFLTNTSVTKGAANDCSVALKVNEVESNGGTPGDWVELYNAGPTSVDLTGYVFKDNDDSHNYAIPSGSVIAAGGYFLLEEAAFGFGLGSADSARLFAPGGSPLVDSYSWTAHAAVTYGRCPNASGSFVNNVTATKSSANDCPGSVTAQTWPGSNDVKTVDAANVFGGNMSGLTYETTSTGGVLWAVKNGPGTLYRLIFSGGVWTPDPANDFGVGKPLRYLDGTGDPDSEGVTRAELDTPFAYVATERNNSNNGVSRPSVLRFDTSAAGTTLSATHEWALVSDLPVVTANTGLEAITWVPDAYLTAHAFFDESAGHAYVPGDYANHGTGLFFVGLEANGIIYAYALDHTTSAFRRIATISSGQVGIMSLEFDRETGYLWAGCDDTCNGQTNVLVVDATTTSATFGRFIVKKQLARPGTMANLNNEGFAVVPEALCSGGKKAVFWSDDSNTDGHALRSDTVPCGAF